MNEHSIGTVLEAILALPPEHNVFVRKNKNGLYTLVASECSSNKAGEYPYITIKLSESCRGYHLLQIPTAMRGFFPGYHEQFVLLTDVKPFVMHLTSGSAASTKGNTEGGYIGHPRPRDIEQKFLAEVPDACNRTAGCFGRWYDAHPEGNVGDKYRIYRLNKELFAFERGELH